MIRILKINKVDKNKITKMEFHKNFIRVFCELPRPKERGFLTKAL